MSARLKGSKELMDKLKKNTQLDEAKNIVKMNTAEMQTNMMRSASFTQGYQTGTTKRFISLELLNDGMTGKVSPGTLYSPYLIYGTRYMAAQDFFRPNFQKQKIQFQQDMQRLVE